MTTTGDSDSEALLALQRAWQSQMAATLHDPQTAAAMLPLMQVWQQLAAAQQTPYVAATPYACTPSTTVTPEFGGSQHAVLAERITLLEQRLAALEKRLARLES
jgi:hypothetical protein